MENCDISFLYWGEQSLCVLYHIPDQPRVGYQKLENLEFTHAQ